MYTIYKHTLPNGKVYIGQTCQDLNDRFSNGFGYANNKCFFEQIVKYGWDNITHEIIATCSTKEDALILERAQIILHRDCTLNRVHSDVPNTYPRNKNRIQPVAQYDTDGNLIAIFSSIKEAAECTGINNGNISSCCRGCRSNSYRRVKSAGGYIWKYAEKTGE